MIVIAMMINISSFGMAQSYKVAIGQLPTIESFKSLVKAIGEAAGATFDVQVVPNARALYLIGNQARRYSGSEEGQFEKL